ncbi:MAG: hypothetical protein NTW14_09515 [bacterium]|nr:hypothetical protein [bacterium]
MRCKVTLAALAATILVGFLLGMVRPAWALPTFARKYGFDCTMCHSSFPRLNDFGQRYRMNGYQLPGREAEDKDVLHSPAPFAMRTSAGISYNTDNNPSNPASDLKRFQVNSLDLLSGGILGRNISYLVVYTPPMAASRSTAGQQASVEMANVVFSNLLCSTWLNLRAGRFEPACIPFSVARRLTISPYEVYNFGSPLGAPVNEPLEGVEVYGYGRQGWNWAAGAVNGTAYTTKVSADFYGRVSKVLGAGWGQTAGQRIGVTAYSGKVPDSTGTLQNFFRFGADASFNAAWINLSIQYILGMDRRELWPSGSTEKYVMHSGGFAQLNLMPIDKLAGFARLDLVKPQKPADLDRDQITRYTAGIRYYFVYQLALHLEYSHRIEKQLTGPDAKEDFGAVRLDFAF